MLDLAGALPGHPLLVVLRCAKCIYCVPVWHLTVVCALLPHYELRPALARPLELRHPSASRKKRSGPLGVQKRSEEPNTMRLGFTTLTLGAKSHEANLDLSGALLFSCKNVPHSPSRASPKWAKARGARTRLVSRHVAVGVAALGDTAACSCPLQYLAFPSPAALFPMFVCIQNTECSLRPRHFRDWIL